MLYRKLASGQSPRALFITCSDSRVDPEAITQMEPGEIFVIRNAGNIVPALGADSGSVSASIEYAVQALQVPNVIICGHSGCGAMKAVLHPDTLEGLPEVDAWIHHASASKAVLDAKYPGVEGEDERLACCVEINVLIQAQNLLTHPTVAARVATGTLKVYGWVFDISTGQCSVFNPASRAFEAVTEDAENDAIPTFL